MTVTQQQPFLKRKTLAVSKDGMFHTFQGEGPRTGQRTVFLRLAGCNLACTWCDTPYTWDFGSGRWDKSVESQLTPIVDLVQEFGKYHCPSITVTGGEPLLQWKNLEWLLNEIPLWEANFETNGLVCPQWNLACKVNYVVSPKLKNSGNKKVTTFADVEPLWMSTWNSFAFKFVCSTVEDLDAVAAWVPEHRMLEHFIWIMPEGVEPGLVAARAAKLAPEVLRRGWNLTLRNQISIWGNKRAT